jgi:hypothetical protein
VDAPEPVKEKVKPVSPSSSVSNWSIGKDDNGIPFARFVFSDHVKLDAITMYCINRDTVGLVIQPKHGLHVKSIYFWSAGDGNELQLNRKNIVNQKDWVELAAEFERLERELSAIRVENTNEPIDPSVPISVGISGEQTAYDFSGMTQARNKLRSMCKSNEPAGPLRFAKILGIVALDKPCFLGLSETAISDYIARNIPVQDRERADQELIMMRAEVARADSAKLFFACAGATNEANRLGLRR